MSKAGKYRRLPTKAPVDEDEEEENSKDDQQRFKMRAISFESYAVISALLFGFTCMAVKWDNGDYTSFRDAQLSRKEAKLDTTDVAKQFLGPSYEAPIDWYEMFFLFHMFCMTLSCSLSIYSTMVFAMCSLYIRSALAMGRTESLHQFLLDLQFQRECAFKAFIAGSALMPADIIFVTFTNLSMHGHSTFLIMVLLSPAAFVSVTAGLHVSKILSTASRTVFAGPRDAVSSRPEEPDDLPLDSVSSTERYC